MHRKLKTLLVSMPFGASDRPALGISLLKSRINELAPHSCEIRYLWREFADQIGLDAYKFLTDTVPYTSFAGDWCFTLPLHGRRPGLDLEYVTEVLQKTWRLPPPQIKQLVSIREQTPRYLSHCLQTVNWTDYDIVGFTSTFTQNLASLALAQQLKISHPGIHIVFGGANWEEDMGRALFETYPFIDFVCQGESDRSFPALVESLTHGTDTSSLAGVLGRSTTESSKIRIESESVIDMDDLPFPDFSDFFSLMDETQFQQEYPVLLMETSRGCWWGAKSHCTFCGLNGENMNFRSKSVDRVMDELTVLVKQNRTPIVSFVDNILDMKYFSTLLPELIQSELDIEAFFEVKSNLNRTQVKILSKSGIRHIQPGIESLSDPILKLMRKGSTCIQNIQLLKWCREHNVTVDWNILYGFPGESDLHYTDMFELFPLLEHLAPPSAVGPIRLDRFSPYFSNPGMFGLTNVRAMDVYRYLYPFDENLRNRIASYFDFDYEKGSEPTSLVGELTHRIELWRQAGTSSELRASDDGQRTLISDKRAYGDRTYELSGIDRLIYGYCDRAKTVRQVLIELKSRMPDLLYQEDDVQRLLDWLTDNRLMYRQGDRFLALAVYQNFPAEFVTNIASKRASKASTMIESVPVQVVTHV